MTRQALRLFLRGLTLIVLSCLLARGTLAAPPDNLLVRSWAQGTDVRQQSLKALLESREGYLWIGTGHGLMRFDGVSFTRFTSTNTKGMAGDRISFGALWEDAHGAIWAGTDFQGVIRDDHGTFQTMQVEQGLADLSVLRIDGDESGAVWIETLKGISHWQNGRLKRVHPDQDGSGGGPLIPLSYSRPIDFAKTGLWRYGKRGLERFAYGRWAQFPTPPGSRQPFENDVRFIYEDHLRRVWYSVWSQPGTYFCAEGEGLQVFHGLPPDAMVSFKDSSGSLWLTDNQARTSLWKDGVLSPLQGLRAPFLIQAIETTGGTVWAGTAGTHVFQFKRGRIQLIPTTGSPELASVLFQQKAGTIWAGGRSLLRLTPAGESRLHPAAHDEKATRSWIQIKALSEDSSGNLLIGSRAPDGVEKLEGASYRPYLPRGALQGTVQALLHASSGEQWIGTMAGLYRVRDGHPARVQTVLTTAVRCISEAAPGQIWVGTSDGPVLFLNGKQQRLEAGWPFGAVVALEATPAGQIWMATQEHGVVLFTANAFHSFGTQDGLPTDNIYSVRLGSDGDLWLGSDAGLIRIRIRSLERRLVNAADRLQITLFDDADGLAAASLDPLGNESSLRLPDGKLWFATENGIAQLDPAALLETSAATHTVMEEHAIDGSELLPLPITLRPGQGNLELHYTALGSKRPEQINFRYRLLGFDKDWVLARGRRVAYYTQLPPGTYTFEVQAADGDSEDWELKGATTEVNVLTPFYLSWWFKTLLLSALGLAVLFVLVTRSRLERERRQLRQAFTHRLISTQEGERKRIAHELHDSLGQHLVLIRTLAMLPARSVDAAGMDPLAKIADQAFTAIQEVEAISYDLRPYQLDRLGLTRAILSLIQTLETSSPLIITHAIVDMDDFLPKDLEINFYRIVQEALGNILKHADATEVKIAVTLAGAVLRLSIRDNGRGFTPAMGTQGGLGLIGIQERAEALGGHAVIESADGLGTEILVRVSRAKLRGGKYDE